MADAMIPLGDVWAMLETCAPGYGRREGEHAHIVTYQGKTYRSLPLGRHGRRKNPPIESGFVRSMARHLGIEACARRRVPQIYTN